MFDKIMVRSLLVAAAILCGSEAWGASLSWQVSSGDWSLASNWSGSVPTVSDDAYIVNGGTATVTQSGR